MNKSTAFVLRYQITHDKGTAAAMSMSSMLRIMKYSPKLIKRIGQGIIILRALGVVPGIRIADIYSAHLSEDPLRRTLPEIDVRSIGFKNQLVNINVWILCANQPNVFSLFLWRGFNLLHFAAGRVACLHFSTILS